MNNNTKRYSSVIVVPDFGKVPPQANDMEEAVLGAIMIEKDAIYDVIEFLKPESFYREAHQKIFGAMVDLIRKGFPVDLFSVSEYLRAHGELECIGGPIYITQLTSKVISACNISYHARIIVQKYMQRELIRISTEVQTRAFDDTYDISELLGYAEESLMNLSENTHKKEPTKLAKLIDKVIDIVQKIINREIELTGLQSGFTTMDRVTGGFKNQELIIIAGRPGMGKSALAFQIAKNIAEFNKPVGLFSCEMSDESVARRFLSNVSGRTNVEILTGKCEIEQLLKTSEQLLKLGIYIDDTSNISLMELRAKTRKLVMKYGIKVLIVDYLQLMKGEGQNREQEVSSISRGLKSIAKDFDIPVIALSQINRESEKAKDKKAQLSDLRESGAIEQDADMVLLLYRPAYYKVSTIISNKEEINTEGLMIVDVAKNRNGATGEFNLKHNISLTHIYEEDHISEFTSNITANKSFSESQNEFEKISF